MNNIQEKLSQSFIRRPGLIIVIEGIDGAGKTTQVKLLDEYLLNKGYKTYISKWNSSALLHEIIAKGKKNVELSPTLYSLLHIADFYERLENDILPAKDLGNIVICDRYYYTSFGRDGARGIDLNWLENIFNRAVEPDMSFFLDCPPDLALGRILKEKEKPKFYEAGQDVTFVADPMKSYILFQKRIYNIYKKYLDKFEVIDATSDISNVHNQIVKKLESLLEKYGKAKL